MPGEITTVLVDSSMFIQLLRDRKDPAYELSSRAQRMDLATCGMVQLEVLRGMRVPRLRDALRQFMSVMLYAAADFRMWDAATDIAWRLDRKGISLPFRVAILWVVHVATPQDLPSMQVRQLD